MRIWLTLLIGSLVAMACAVPAMGAPRAKKLTDLTCEAGQTIIFDGADWRCTDLSHLSRSDTYAVQATLDVPAGGGDLGIARCENLGDIVLSGGYFFQAGSTAIVVDISQPNVDSGVPMGWEVSINNVLSVIPAEVFIRALCLRVP
jgi:hypothetical protein